MTKTADKGVLLFKEKGHEERETFLKTLKDLGFENLDPDRKIDFLINQAQQIPKRVNSENVKQDQYKYESKTGYSVCIHSGMIGLDFIDKGSAWVIITNEKDERVFVREFYRTLSKTLMIRLRSYAKLAKKIADSRKPGFQLEEISETKMHWEKGKEERPFSIGYYTQHGLTKEEQFCIQNGEARRKRYRKNTEGMVRRERKFRSTWT